MFKEVMPFINFLIAVVCGLTILIIKENYFYELIFCLILNLIVGFYGLYLNYRDMKKFKEV